MAAFEALINAYQLHSVHFTNLDFVNIVAFAASHRKLRWLIGRGHPCLGRCLDSRDHYSVAPQWLTLNLGRICLVLA